MPLQEILQTASRTVNENLQSIAPGLPPDLLRHAGATVLVCLALLLLIAAASLLRKKKPTVSRDIFAHLSRKGVMLDVMNGPKSIALRCAITSASRKRLKCAVVERLDLPQAEQGENALCMFAPARVDDRTVNAFYAEILELDLSKGEAGRIVLARPNKLFHESRRSQKRKRVVDQQFVRVKLWLADPQESDIAFEDAVPHIGVNAFASRNGQSANSVINISKGGMALSISDSLLPETCGVGAPVTVNLFMFRFRDKEFHPFWYQGEVRSLGQASPGFTRIGIEFTGVGRFTGRELIWNNL